MVWNGGVGARPAEENPGGRANTIFDAGISTVIFNLIDRSAIQAKNPGFDAPFWYQMSDSFPVFSRDIEYRCQLALTPCGLLIVRID